MRCVHAINRLLINSVPAVSPVGVTERLSATSIKVTWDFLTREESRGVVTSYHVKYRPVDRTVRRNIDDLSIVVNTTNSETVIEDLDPRVVYAVSLAASTSAGIGNYSDEITVECKHTC